MEQDRRLSLDPIQVIGSRYNILSIIHKQQLCLGKHSVALINPCDSAPSFVSFCHHSSSCIHSASMDRISELPDCILSYILSMLPIKDLLKTSVLSTRWWNLWLLRRDLNFDTVNMFGRKVEMKRTEKDLIDLERTEFVQRVNQFFQKFNTTKIDSLRVAYHLTSGQRSSIDRWISFGLTRGVERIYLNFTSYDYVYTSKLERYVFPLPTLSKSGVSTLKHIHLQSCILPNPPANFSAVPFRNLRSLVLYHVHVGQDLITSLLSECVLLEELSLIGCEFALLKLKIVSSSLLHLHFSQSRENWITFECQKLSYLEFYGDIPLCYRDILWCCATKAPLLKRVLFNIYPTSTMPDILASLANLPQLEILSLDVFQTTNISLVENSLRTIPPFKNLKELNLFIAGELMDEELKYEFDNLWIFTILRACPLLQKLSIMFICPKLLANQKENKDLGMFSHNELKVIELGGCIGNWYEIEFAMNVLKYVHTLERIIMSPFWKYPGYFGSSLYSDEEWFQNGREIVREKLHCCEKAGQAQLILI